MNIQAQLTGNNRSKRLSLRGEFLRCFFLLIALLPAFCALNVHAQFPLHSEISLSGNAETDIASFIFPTRSDEDIIDVLLVNNFTRTSILRMFTVTREPATGYSRLTVTPAQDFDGYGTTSFTLVVQTRRNPGGAIQETFLQAETVRDAFADSVVSPYVKQLAEYLKGRVASGDLRESDALAQFAATAQYFGIRSGQIDRLLGLLPGYAKTVFDLQLNPYDWFNYYLNPLVAKSGEVPPTIGAIRLLSSTATTLNVSWDITAPNGLRNLQYSLGAVNSLSGQFDGLTGSTEYSIVAQAETRNVYLNTWQPVRQTARFTTLAANPPVATNLSAAQTYTEQVDLNLTGIVVTAVDSSNVTVRLTLSNPAIGALTTATSGSVTSSYVAGTGVWTASGPIASVNTLLAGVTFKPKPNVSASFTIATEVSDGVNVVRGSKSITGVASGTTVISSTSDTVADDGLCTLREAIIASNTNTPSGSTPGECNGAHTLIAPVGNLTFSGTDLSFSSNITLRSVGPGLTTLKSTSKGITLASGTISLTDCAIDAALLTIQSAASVTLNTTSGAASVVLSGALTNNGALKGTGAISITAASVTNNKDIIAMGNITLNAATIHNDTAGGDTRVYQRSATVADHLVGTDECYLAGFCSPDRQVTEHYSSGYTDTQVYAGGTPSVKPQIISGGTLTLQNFSTGTNVGGVLSAPTVTLTGTSFNNNDLSLNSQVYVRNWDIYTEYIAAGPLTYHDHELRNDTGNVLQSTTEISTIGAGVFATTLNAGGFTMTNRGAPFTPSL